MPRAGEETGTSRSLLPSKERVLREESPCLQLSQGITCQGEGSYEPHFKRNKQQQNQSITDQGHFSSESCSGLAMIRVSHLDDLWLSLGKIILDTFLSSAFPAC